MKKYIGLITVLSAASTIASSQPIALDSIPDGSGYTYIASPTGTGTFPAVLYNHGGLGTSVGGDLRETALALARNGYLARCEKRMETIPITGHLEEVEAALDSLRADPRADTNCVTIIGFSRGGYLTLEAAKQNPGKVHSIITMAPANPNNLLGSLVADVSPIDDPVLILVANNDTIQDDHVALAQMVYDSLIAGGKTATFTVYPDYDSNGDSITNSSDDGHELFFIVQNPYWADVINFLNANCSPNGLKNSIEKTKTLKIYPNPFNNEISLYLPASSMELKIFDVMGKIVFQKIASSEHETLNLNLPNGIYFLQIKNDNFTQTKKIEIIK